MAENRAVRQIPTKMIEWSRFLDQFLTLSEYPILLDKGKISALEARLKAEHEYETYRIIQDREYISDFDKQIKQIKDKNN